MAGDACGGPPPCGPRSPWPEPPDLTAPRGGQLPIIDQAFDGESLYAMREAVAAHAAQAGLSEGRVVDLVLAVHELAANAVRHGAGRGRLRVWNTGHALRCEITDHGTAGTVSADGAARATGAHGADPAAWEASLWPVERGHGLWLIRQVADRASLHVGPRGTVATVSFALRAPGPPASFGLTQRSAGGCAIVAVTGQLDLGSAGQLTALAADLMAGHRGLRLVLDLTRLASWDSAGLAALLAVQRRVSDDPAARMVLAGLPGHLAKRLHATGLAGRFTLAGTTAEAVDRLASRQ